MHGIKLEKLSPTQAKKEGFRSTLELYLAKCLRSLRKKFRYEKVKIKYYIFRIATYTPDFVLYNGIIIETKGWFKPSDRVKHLRIKEQHPALDIRFIFNNEHSKISPTSKTTYGSWCDKHGFKYATRVIPEGWLNEKGKDTYPKVIDVTKKGIDKLI